MKHELYNALFFFFYPLISADVKPNFCIVLYLYLTSPRMWHLIFSRNQTIHVSFANKDCSLFWIIIWSCNCCGNSAQLKVINEFEIVLIMFFRSFSAIASSNVICLMVIIILYTAGSIPQYDNKHQKVKVKVWKVFISVKILN